MASEAEQSSSEYASAVGEFSDGVGGPQGDRSSSLPDSMMGATETGSGDDAGAGKAEAVEGKPDASPSGSTASLHHAEGEPEAFSSQSARDDALAAKAEASATMPPPYDGDSVVIKTTGDNGPATDVAEGSAGNKRRGELLLLGDLSLLPSPGALSCRAKLYMMCSCHHASSLLSPDDPISYRIYFTLASKPVYAPIRAANAWCERRLCIMRRDVHSLHRTMVYMSPRTQRATARD